MVELEISADLIDSLAALKELQKMKTEIDLKIKAKKKEVVALSIGEVVAGRSRKIKMPDNSIALIEIDSREVWDTDAVLSILDYTKNGGLRTSIAHVIQTKISINNFELKKIPSSHRKEICDVGLTIKPSTPKITFEDKPNVQSQFYE